MIGSPLLDRIPLLVGPYTSHTPALSPCQVLKTPPPHMARKVSVVDTSSQEQVRGHGFAYVLLCSPAVVGGGEVLGKPWLFDFCVEIVLRALTLLAGREAV